MSHKGSEKPDAASHSAMDASETKEELEVRKIREEIARLRSENTRVAALGRNIWPLVSGVLAILVSVAAGLVTWKAQTFSSEEDRKKIFFSAVQMATDAKSGQDSRIAGIWTLADYWHDPDLSQTVANTLAAILVTDPDDATAIAESRAERVREAAAEVVGLAYDTKTKNDEQVRLRIILYGNSQTGELGAITRYQQELTSQEAIGSADQQIQPKLQATREAIRNNWENLESGMFYKHDLSQIKLYEAKARGAFFGDAILAGANLCGADLSGAKFTAAKLKYADLAGADLDGSQDWLSADLDLTGANIHGVKNPPADFLAVATRDKAFNLPFKEWIATLQSKQIDFYPEIYTNCDRY